LQQCFLTEFCWVHPREGKILREQLQKEEVQEKVKRAGRRS